MAELDIGEVVRRSGLTPATLRYYEQQGLIRPLGRSGLRRVYAGDVVERLSLIALGQAAGFSLKDVRQMFGADGRPRIDRRRLAVSDVSAVDEGGAEGARPLSLALSPLRGERGQSGSCSPLRGERG